MAISEVEYKLSDRFRAEQGKVLLTGVQALARIPIDQLRLDQLGGLNTAAFLSGYPGSPLGGFDLEVARAIKLVPELPIVHQPAVNEELGATSVMGSQLAPGRPDATYDGVVGFWYGKAPGLDRAGDSLRHGVFAGASPKGGAVVLVGDDPDCKSSTMPSSSDATLVDLHMPILYPGNAAECVELGLHAVAISRASGLWSSMKIVTSVADGSGTVDLPALSATPIMPTIEIDGVKWQCQPSAQFLGQRMVEVEREFREVRLPLAHEYGVLNKLNRVSVNPTDAWIGLVATGFTYYEMLDALRRLGLETPDEIANAGIRLLQLRMPVPFDAGLVREFAMGLDEILVVEEKNPTLEWLIKDALYGGPHQPRVLGKTHEDGRTLMPSWGRLDADTMLSGLRERLSPRLGERLVPAAQERTSIKLIPLEVNRTPFFCSGCPHNWGTKVPDGALVGAGTGCHGMTLLMEPERVGEGIGITAMGNEGAQWIGMEPFVEAGHMFQNYGDGTFMHSAQLALQYCIGAGKHMTFKILFNSTVAMTGGQDATYSLGVKELAAILLAQGVSKVAVTAEDLGRYDDVDLPAGVEVHDRTEIVAVQEDLRSTPGVTVLIHDQECAAELRRARRRGKLTMPSRRIIINHRICEGCGDCGDVSNCLSVQPVDTPLGRKTTIDQASCNYDESCLNGDCPAFMSVEVEPGNLPDPNQNRSSATSPSSSVPDPVVGRADRVNVRLAGIGGTGVVTVAQILATAAMFDGWEVQGLDQTGLSQKAGPVISDVVLSRSGVESSNFIGAGQADVVLGFDSLVAAADGTIRAASADATHVVVSTRRTPTGKMISDPGLGYPDASVGARLEATSAGTLRQLDSSALSHALTGNSAQANVLLLGVAVQDGRIPVSVGSLERAIELNGVAVEANLAAFDWGRRWAHDSDAVEQLAGTGTDVTAYLNTVTVAELPKSLSKRIKKFAHDAKLAELLEMLAADLVGYQNKAYAADFIDAVAAASESERRVRPTSAALTEAVARNLHKLMAYKDEYEVARLMLMPEAIAAAESVGGADPDYSWHLHPPMLKALGLDSKLKFGSSSKPVFTTLAAGKRLRGTALDPFGRNEMRRTERELPGEYLETMAFLYERLSDLNLDQAIEIAKLPDLVRGYEELKLRRVAEYRSKLTEALSRFAG